MAVQYQINKELISYIRAASGLSTADFAAQIGVDPKSVRAYTAGEYLPRKPAVIAKLQKLANKYGAGEFAVGNGELKAVSDPVPDEGTDTTETTKKPKSKRKSKSPKGNDELSPKILKELQTTRGLTGPAAAALIGVSAATWYNWVAGKTKPQGKSTKLLRKLLGTQKKGSTPEPAQQAKGGKRQVSSDLFRELGSDFKAQFQPKLDEAVIDYALTLVCEKLNVNRRDLRRQVSALLLLLKDRVDPEDLFAHLSGHD